MGQLDAIYRYGNETSPMVGPQSPLDYLSIAGEDYAKDWSQLAREVLGRPGPSFIFQWQEDGIAEASVLAACANNWPPSFWQSSPASDDWCLSPWLTVPNACIRVYVPEKCVARISCAARGDLTFSAVGHQILVDSGGGVNTFDITYIDKQVHFRDRLPMRFGIVVDTNPDLYDDEFANTNVNIKQGGGTAPYVSWKVLEDKTFYSGQHQSYALDEEVALKGGRWYNFRFTFRDPSIRGCVYDTGATTWWYSGAWYSLIEAQNWPNWDATWLALADRLSDAQGPGLPGLILWETADIQVEFFYGRSTANIYNSNSSEFGS